MVNSGRFQPGHKRGMSTRFKKGQPKSPNWYTTVKHGHAKAKTPVYRSWMAMMGRCFNPNLPEYRNYGGRGITVCQRWRDFRFFLADMGDRPKGKSLERIDNDGDYEPGNCRWATKKEQQRNRRACRNVTAFGKTQCLTAWSDETGLHPACIRARLERGWDAERAVTQGTEGGD